MKVALSFIWIWVCFTTYTYFDAKQMLKANFMEVLMFGLRPQMLLFYALTPILLWWSYRQIFISMKGKFWATSLILSLVIRLAIISGSYLGSQIVPSGREFLGLFLGTIAILIAVE